MAESRIDYCDRTLEVTGGCTKCSPGCKNCWAIKEVWRMAHNPLLGDKWQGLVEKKNGVLNWMGKIKCFEDALDIRRKKPTTYFIDSKADLFHPKVPFDFILKVIGITIANPWHTYLILTKRPGRMYDFFACWPDGWFIREGMKHSTFSNEFFAIDSIQNILTEKVLQKANDFWVCNYDQSKRGKLDGPVPFPQPNLHLGVSISTADEMWKATELSRIPATVRFISFEPLLEDVGEIPLISNREDDNDLEEFGQHIDWVVVGGESGPRPMHPDWVRNIRDQCVAAGVAFYFKQWGTHAPCDMFKGLKKPGPVVSLDGQPAGMMTRVGKKKAGRILDGKEWNQLPERR